MKFVYIFFAVLGVLVGLFFWTRADSAMNQIEVLIIWLSATVLMVAMEVRSVLDEMRQGKKMEHAKPANSDEAVVTSEMIDRLMPRAKPR